MRRFIHTIFVKRRGQATVIFDSETREFEVCRISAEHGLEVVRRFDADKAGGRDDALELAKAVAADLRISVEQPADPTAAALGIAAPAPTGKASRQPCQWCPDYDPAQAVPGVTTFMCAACYERLNDSLDDVAAAKGNR